jgi:hypothetical protein
MILAVASRAYAGPEATVTFRDGRSTRVEIKGFQNGTFTLHNRETHEVLQVSQREIRAIDFGAKAILHRPPPSPATNDTEFLWAAARRQEYRQLAPRIRRVVGLRGTEAVLPFKKSLKDKAESPELAPEERRDLKFSLVVTHYVLGETVDGGKLLRELTRDYPHDRKVNQFVEMIRQRGNWLRRYPGRPTSRDEPGRGPRDLRPPERPERTRENDAP